MAVIEGKLRKSFSEAVEDTNASLTQDCGVRVACKALRFTLPMRLIITAKRRCPWCHRLADHQRVLLPWTYRCRLQVFTSTARQSTAEQHGACSVHGPHAMLRQVLQQPTRVREHRGPATPAATEHFRDFRLKRADGLDQDARLEFGVLVVIVILVIIVSIAI